MEDTPVISSSDQANSLMREILDFVSEFSFLLSSGKLPAQFRIVVKLDAQQNYSFTTVERYLEQSAIYTALTWSCLMF